MTLAGAGDRLRRDATLACLVLACGALLVWPREWRMAAGILGGGALIGLSAWAIRAGVDGLLAGSGEMRHGLQDTENAPAPRSPLGLGHGLPRAPSGRAPGRAALVKFFTRHAILALAAYGMMARLKLDPVGMLVGVSCLAVAVGLEAARGLQARHDGGSSR